MIVSARQLFNKSFSEDKYQNFVQSFEDYAGEKIPFRIAETPVFIPSGLRTLLEEACEYIIGIIKQPDFKSLTDRSIPAGLHVPGEDQQPLWLAFDFAVCRNNSGSLEPQLIEMQGFPSLFFYQDLLAHQYRKFYPIPDGLHHLPVHSEEEYHSHMRDMLLNGHAPENVILLEVEPDKQPTRIDFLATYNHTGIRPVCISKIVREGRKLFYHFDGKKIPVHRIYNRVIFDEFTKRTDLKCEFNMVEDVDVEWAGHPNWFFRVSKFTMPFLNHRFIPRTTFLHELKNLPADLENYVLKPLFSFSGSGVVFYVTKEEFEKVKDPENWILQRKVNYEPVIAAPDGMVKTEIRMLYSWAPGTPSPKLIINMARLSRGEMIGVKYNKDKTWVGGSVGFFEI